MKKQNALLKYEIKTIEQENAMKNINIYHPHAHFIVI